MAIIKNIRHFNHRVWASLHLWPHQVTLNWCNNYVRLLFALHRRALTRCGSEKLFFFRFCFFVFTYIQQQWARICNTREKLIDAHREQQSKKNNKKCFVRMISIWLATRFELAEHLFFCSSLHLVPRSSWQGSFFRVLMFVQLNGFLHFVFIMSIQIQWFGWWFSEMFAMLEMWIFVIMWNQLMDWPANECKALYVWFDLRISDFEMESLLGVHLPLLFNDRHQLNWNEFICFVDERSLLLSLQLN